MVEYVLEYLANFYGQSANSQEELEKLTRSIENFLADYGISAEEDDALRRSFTLQLLQRIRPVHLKSYFLCYKQIQLVRRSVLAYKDKPDEMPVRLRAECAVAIAHLNLHGLGTEYLPRKEVRRVLKLRV